MTSIEWVVAVAAEDAFGDPVFKFMVYEGPYWRALWAWLTGEGDG